MAGCLPDKLVRELGLVFLVVRVDVATLSAKVLYTGLHYQAQDGDSLDLVSTRRVVVKEVKEAYKSVCHSRSEDKRIPLPIFSVKTTTSLKQ
jgi:hypothetical protein